MPHVSCYSWDHEVHPGYWALTCKGYLCYYDELTQFVYYPNMETPTGTFFGGVGAGVAMGEVMDENGYDTCMEITNEEAIELFGEIDMSTLNEDMGVLQKSDKYIRE